MQYYFLHDVHKLSVHFAITSRSMFDRRGAHPRRSGARGGSGAEGVKKGRSRGGWLWRWRTNPRVCCAEGENPLPRLHGGVTLSSSIGTATSPPSPPRRSVQRGDKIRDQLEHSLAGGQPPLHATPRPRAVGISETGKREGGGWERPVSLPLSLSSKGKRNTRENQRLSQFAARKCAPLKGRAFLPIDVLSSSDAWGNHTVFLSSLIYASYFHANIPPFVLLSKLCCFNFVSWSY